jgi:hypothetical protein
MKCPHCPVAGHLTCLGETTPPLCILVEAGQPGRAEQLVALAEGGPPAEWETGPVGPSLITRAGNLARSVVAHVADGGRKASAEVQAARKAECEACPLLVDNKCSQCGCVAMNLKRSWASSRCPLDPPKWDAV